MWKSLIRSLSSDVAPRNAASGTVGPPPRSVTPIPVTTGKIDHTETATVAPPPRIASARVEQKLQLPARMVLAVDPTASRGPTWETAKRLTDQLLVNLPEGLEVALAVHGGGKVRLFTEFTRHAEALRDAAASIRCESGGECLLEILKMVLAKKHVSTVIYIGDNFEEDEREARALANKLRRNEVRLIVLHEAHKWTTAKDRHVFADMAARSGGTLLPFHNDSFAQLSEMLQAIAVLAVGGVEAVEAQQAVMPAAPLLLERLAESKQLLLPER